MNNPQPAVLDRPIFGELNRANDWIGNRQALDEAWARDGYWYFQQVIPPEIIGAMRKVWMDVLRGRGVVDEGETRNRYNGKVAFAEDRLSNAVLASKSDQNFWQLRELNELRVTRLFTENAEVNALMRQVLGDDPFWLPIAECRAHAPGDDPERSRIMYAHQDGFYSRGLDMKIVWVAIDEIDAYLGGCAWVEGAHRGPILHDLGNPPTFPIPMDQIPADGWKSAHFKPGDVVIFDLNTPHSGLTNVSKDRFRMSFDIRVMNASGPTPTVGWLVSLDEHQVTVRDERGGAEVRYTVGPDTYVRGIDARKREGADIANTFEPGEYVIVNSLDGVNATLVRATK